MKQVFFFFLACFSAFLLNAQGTIIQISGQTVDVNGTVVPNWPVTAYNADSVNTIPSPGMDFQITNSDQNGFYSMNLILSNSNPIGGYNFLVESYTGCTFVPYTTYFFSNEPSVTADFFICRDTFVQPDCQAYFGYDYLPAPSGVGANVNFYDFSNWADSSTQIVSYAWDFGDGTTSTEANPQHYYAADGIYYVTLTIVTDSGCSSSYGYDIYVANLPECEVYYWYNLPGWPGSTSNAVEFFSQVNWWDSSVVVTSYLWDFGDSTTSTEANPWHEYAQLGDYEVTLTIETSTGCTATYVSWVYLIDVPPFPLCYGYILHQQVDSLTYTFSGEAYNDWGINADIISYEWDFGDGNTSTEANPTHTYAQTGYYNVLLHFVTADSCDGHACDIIFDGNFPIDTFWYGCQAMFGYNSTSIPGNPVGGNPLEIQFYDQSFSVTVQWAWDFGDNTISNEQNPIHTYAQEGTYLVSLTTVALDGCQSTMAFEIYVGDNYPWIPEIDCQAMFMPFPDSTGGPNSIQFVDFSYSIGAIQSWTWDFGDGSTSSEQNPIHAYTTAGEYTVSLNIVGDSCNSVISFVIDTDSPWNFNLIAPQLGVSGLSSATPNIPDMLQTVKAFPNPTSGDFNLYLESLENQAVQVSVRNLQGALVNTIQKDLHAGANQILVPMSGLPAGMYLTEIRSKNSVKTLKISKL